MQLACAYDVTDCKFTGKERASESGLDNFGARYDASNLGRFMTPDWAAKPTSVPYANFGNPQSLNLYSFVENNPTTLGDPDGHVPWGFGGLGADCPTDNCQNNMRNWQQQVAATAAIAAAQNQSSGCGWCQKLVNGVRGAGWKTDQQIAQEAINNGEPPNGEYSFV